MGSVFLAELVTVEDPENSIGTAIWLDSSDPFLTAMKTLGKMLIFSCRVPWWHALKSNQVTEIGAFMVRTNLASEFEFPA